MTHEETIQALQAQVADLQRRMGIFAYLTVGFEYMGWGAHDYETANGMPIGSLLKQLAPFTSLKDVPGLPILRIRGDIARKVWLTCYALFYDETDNSLLIADNSGEVFWFFAENRSSWENNLISTGLYT